MVKIKAYTDIEQSKVLAKILPLESADMCYHYDFDELESIPAITEEDDHFVLFPKDVPAWSTAALLSVLPDEIIDGDVYRNMFFHLRGKYNIQYTRLTTLWPSLLSVEADNIIDAAFEMILRLHELNLL